MQLLVRQVHWQLLCFFRKSKFLIISLLDFKYKLGACPYTGCWGGGGLGAGGGGGGLGAGGAGGGTGLLKTGLEGAATG